MDSYATKKFEPVHVRAMYADLKGETFVGTYVQDKTSRYSRMPQSRQVIKSSQLGQELHTKLSRIEEQLEGQVWKGFVSDGSSWDFYVTLDGKHEIGESGLCKIKDFELFSVTENLTGYASGLGVSITLTMEKELSKPPRGFTETDCSTLYQKAIRDNPTITLHISKAMTIGPPQVGKTTVRRRLLGLSLPEVSSSTPVMERADTVSLCSFDCTSSNEVGSSSARSSDEHSPESKDEASSDDSEGETSDDSDNGLGQSVAKRCKYESHTYMEDGNEWVMLNNASVMHSLLTHLQEKIGGRLPTSNSRLRQLESGHYVYLEDQHPSALIVGYNPSSVADMSRQMHQELQDTDKAIVLPDARLLQFLDCGGQLAYHDILPIFVNIPAIYLHVFKVSKELTECPIDELCSPRGGKKYSAKSALSVAEMITRSVMTVHLLADKRDTLPAVLKCDSKSPKPHVVLVGTHLDALDEKDRDARLKTISGTLRQAVHSESHDLEGMLVKDPKRYGTFFPVSNVSQKKCTFKYLKRRIRKQAEADAVKVEVPVRWYLHLLLEISQGEKSLYAYSEFYKHCKRKGSITDLGEFHAMVTYFHALGLLVHLCEADVSHTEDSECLVFTNPSFLYENISKIYQVQFEDEVEGLGKIKLKREGKLTEEALQELGVQLDHNHFMDLLVQLFIGAEIKPQKVKKEKREEGKEEGEERRKGKRRKRTLFVPSVLVNSTSHSAGDATPSGVNAATQKHSVSFAIAFKHTSFVPCGVFTGMIARLQSAPGWDICTSSISRTRMKFAVGALGTVNVLDCATHISVEIGHHVGLKPEQYQEYRDTIVPATADSFCFLFHSKADRDPQSGTCIACSNDPYLVLGQTCRLCSSQPGVTRKVPHFAELKVENYIPVSVRCWEQAATPKALGDSELERVPFHDIFHNAVIEEQHTRHTQKGTVAMKGPRCVSSGTDLAEQVLDHFRDRFITEMDANAIVMELEHRGIISNGDREAIKQERDASQQNQLLHARLKKTCTVQALMHVCGIITMVEGNPKLKSLGIDMKTELEKGS